jgi:hypothetical protein
MANEKYYHYSYQIQEFGENIDGNVTYGSQKDEQVVTAFIREDLQDTFPDGAILSLKLTAVTDETGRRM